MFRRLLIANRGEIACRIAATAKRMGLCVIAVHSEADAGARHVRAADESVCIGPARAQASYLDIDALIDAARRTGAEAVHPGYGFLSENAEFAERVAGAGLVFVGPPAEAIRAMGSKSAAKKIAADANVPLVPGYHESETTPERLAEAAAEIGYPVLVKASAGGGGRGMRIVERAGDLPAALAAAEREASAAFGDGTLLLERYIARPRHVEVQVLADAHGTVLHLLDRDCSIQRRHQKVIEEAPAPGLPDSLRAEMGEAAVRLTRAIGYVGAGTVEFLVEGNSSFHFIEMKHPPPGRAPGDRDGGPGWTWSNGSSASPRASRLRWPRAISRLPAMPSRRGSMPRTRRGASCRRRAGWRILPFPRAGRACASTAASKRGTRSRRSTTR